MSRRRHTAKYFVSFKARGSSTIDDAMLESLCVALGEHEPVVGGDSDPNVVTAHFALEATGIEDAVAHGLQALHAALEEVGLGDTALVGVEALDQRAMKEEIARPPLPPLAGVGEIAALLGVSRQRASVIARSKGFPEPIAELAAGPVFNRHAVERFAETWDRRGGRPRKYSA